MCKYCQATTSEKEMSSGRMQRSYSSRNARPWPRSLHSHAEPRPHVQLGCQPDPLEQPVGPHILVKAPNKGSFLHKTLIFLLAYRTAAHPTTNHTVVMAHMEHIFKTNLCRNVHEYCDYMKQHKHANSSTQQHPAWCRESLSQQPEAPGGNSHTLSPFSTQRRPGCPATKLCTPFHSHSRTSSSKTNLWYQQGQQEVKQR